MQHDQKELHQIAQNCPYYLFTIEQIASLCNVSRDVVTKARLADDSPFFLNKCRPEWFAEWMRKHPEFQLTKGQVSDSTSKESCATTPCPRCGQSRTLNRLRKKRGRGIPEAVQR